jgi:hypothetical protein
MHRFDHPCRNASHELAEPWRGIDGSWTGQSVGCGAFNDFMAQTMTNTFPWLLNTKY